MVSVEMIRIFVDYHIATTRRVWESIEQLTDEQFIAEEAYSCGSIRNLMVHLAHTDLRWMTGLKNLPDIVDQLKDFSAYPDRASARAYWEDVAHQLSEFVSTLTEAELEACTTIVSEPRWQVLLHMVNHGTDHRATVLQKLHEFGAPTFSQDFIIWLWSKAQSPK